MAFALTKWYLDVVADDERVAIGYWAHVAALGVSHAVCGRLLSPAGQAGRRFTLRAAAPPEWQGDDLAWTCPALGISVRAVRRARPFARTLLTTPSGSLEWSCEAPIARVRFAIDDEVIEGAGYVERMSLGIAPWALPISRIAWGRWTGPARSVVWIEWRGAHPLRLAWLDGTPVDEVRIDATRIDLGARGELALADHTVITDATIGDQLTSLAPLRALIDRVAHHRQTRWRSRGTLGEPGGHQVPGWAVHEVVTWA